MIEITIGVSDLSKDLTASAVVLSQWLEEGGR